MMEKVTSNIPVVEKPIIPPDINNPPSSIPLKSYGENYQDISNLGNGSFGSVVLAKYKQDKATLLKVDIKKKGTLIDPLTESDAHLSCLVAIKTMKTPLRTLDEATSLKEVKFILCIPSHPSLVQIYDMFIDNKQFSLHIVMESMNQNLYQLMRARKRIKFSPATLKSVLTQLLEAIRHIHKHDYFHRDVKPENILIMPTLQYYGSRENIPPSRRGDNYVLKLADYGLARHIGNLCKYTSYVATRWYRSPEILLRRMWYSKPVDMWAFGTIAVEVANFIPLFPGASEVDQIWRVLEVLGSPTLPSFGTHLYKRHYYAPLGGYWKEAQLLSSRLGFSLPYTDGVQLCNLIPDSVSELGEVVKACLTWNPDVRADVDTICAMSYFKNTSVSKSYKDPERPSNKLARPTPLKEVNSPFQQFSGIQPYKMSLNDFNSKKRIKNSSSFESRTLNVPQYNNENYCNNSFSQTKNNVMLKTEFQIHDDFDDGYEKEFMKEYIGKQAGNSDTRGDVLDFEDRRIKGPEDDTNITPRGINNTPPELAEEYCNESFNFYDLNYSNNEGDAIITEYDSENTYSKNDHDYSWEGFNNLDITNNNNNNNNNNNTEQYFSNNLAALKEPLEDEFGIIADISFGSSHGIKC
ncbi:unnamed protein product [Debaryomyces fabryi]|nr:unnamed protein product [Debaryomyces fabryi]